MYLIISPHADDEVIGCGGFIHQAKDRAFVYFCGIEMFHQVSRTDRVTEVGEVSKYLKYSCDINFFSTVNGYKVVDFIDVFQEIINEVKPDKIFIPYPSYNQDHQVIHHAAMIALRPHDRNFFVKKVLVYEGMGAFQWMNNDYKPNYFVPIDIEAKIEAYKLHKSQVREFRSFDHVRALAKLRGSQIGVPYAEAFMIERWVE